MAAAQHATLNLSDADRDAALQRLRRFALFMDSSMSVPGTSFTFGADAVIGLLPVGGDLAGALLACYVPFEAYRVGAPAALIAKMVGNILIEAVVGSVPLVGDLFDVAFKANLRNVRLLEDYLGA